MLASQNQTTTHHTFYGKNSNDPNKCKSGDNDAEESSNENAYTTNAMLEAHMEALRLVNAAAEERERVWQEYEERANSGREMNMQEGGREAREATVWAESAD